MEVPHVALVPIQTSSPERRITSQKEIIAGEERPRYLLIKQHQDPPAPPPPGILIWVDFSSSSDFLFV